MITLFGKPEPTLLDRLKESVGKTRSALSSSVGEILLGERRIDPALLSKLETALLSADIGVRTTREILDGVRAKVDRQDLSNAAQLKSEIKAHLVRILASAEPSVAKTAGLAVSPNGTGPRVIFVVGVNGAGKTTSIGKLTHRLRQDGCSVILCAADKIGRAHV